MCDTACSFGFDDTDGEASQAGDVFRAIASADAATVLIIVPVEDIMTAVFDAPVATVGSEHPLRIRLFRGPAGDAIGDFTGRFPGFFLCGLALDDKRLSEVREVQIAVEFGGSPDFADFDAAVIRCVGMDNIRALAVVKKLSNVLKKTGLALLISLVRLSSSLAATGRGPTFLGCSSSCSDDRWRS